MINHGTYQEIKELLGEFMVSSGGQDQIWMG